jgi:predicted DNA-binding protein YlxM (UPF0122 family)
MKLKKPTEWMLYLNSTQPCWRISKWNYIRLYYADDYSLAEIAEEFNVSRQAVYDNIKRTEKLLEDYEMKLHMYSDYVVRSQILIKFLLGIREMVT